MITLVYGVPGSGKSVLLHSLVQLQEKSQRFLVIDHAQEWGPDAEHWLGNVPEKITIVEEGDNIPEFEDTGVYVFRGWDPLVVAQMGIDLGWSVFVDDEIDASGGKEGWKDSPLREYVHRGRHKKNAQGEICEIHIMGACRRPQSLHVDLQSLADNIFIFRVQGSLTFQRLRQDSIIEDDMWSTIRRLDRGNYFHWPSGKFHTPKGSGWKETLTPKLIPLPESTEESQEG